MVWSRHVFSKSVWGVILNPFFFGCEFFAGMGSHRFGNSSSITDLQLVLPEDQSDANVIGLTCETQDECCPSQVSLEMQ